MQRGDVTLDTYYMFIIVYFVDEGLRSLLVYVDILHTLWELCKFLKKFTISSLEQFIFVKSLSERGRT